MAKKTYTYAINGSADACAKLYLDPAFNNALYREKLGFAAFAVTDQSETDVMTLRNYAGKTARGLQSIAQQQRWTDLSYRDSISFTKSTRTGIGTFAPAFGGGKVRWDLDVQIVATSETQSNLVLTYLIEALVFGVGELIAGAIDHQLMEESASCAALMNEWMAAGRG